MAADVAGQPHPAAIGRDVHNLADVGAVELHRVGAVLALDDVAAVTGIPDEGIVTGTEQGRIVATSTVDGVVAVAAEQHIGAVAAGDGVVARTTVDGEADQVGEAIARGDGVAAIAAIDDQRVVAGLAASDIDLFGQPANLDGTAGGYDLDLVAAAGTANGHSVRQTVTGTAAGCPTQIDIDLRDAGLAQISDRNIVGTAERHEIDTLDAVEVHGNGADVTGQPRAMSISRDIEPLADIRTVELERVAAVAAVDRVAAVAGIPDEGVVAGAELSVVVAAAAVDQIIAVPADQRIGAVTTSDGVVAGAAVEGERDEAGEAIARSDDVIAAIGVDHEILGGADIEREGSGADAIEANARAIGRDGEHLGAVAAIDLGGVVAVAAFHQIGSLTGIPDHAVIAGFAEHLVVADATGERVVAGASEQHIVAALAEQDVVAGTAEQQVIARAAGEDVVARATEQLRSGQRAIGLIERDRVVAAGSKHLDQGCVGDRRSSARDGDGTAVNQDSARRIAAHYDAVVGVVVGY